MTAKKVTTAKLLAMKQQAEKITAVTAYDASFANLFDQQGVDVLLVGDSLGMVLQGHDDTLPVTIDDMVYHTRSARRGVEHSLLIADMPFMSYANVEQTCINAGKLMAAGASMVKIEGGSWLCDSVEALLHRGVPVCGHLGLTPQSVHVFGGFKVQGRNELQAEQMLEQALQLQQAGVQLLVLECVPAALGKAISEALTIPVIGIGAGVNTDGQILVMHDMLGISANYMPRFSKNYLAETGDIRRAIDQYISDVRSATFPGPEHSFE